MTDLILPGSNVIDMAASGQHLSRSQREIHGLRTLAEQFAIQNRKLFAIVTALVERHGPVLSLSAAEIDASLDPEGKNDALCGFAVNNETGEVTLYTREMAPMVYAALTAEVKRKQGEAENKEVAAAEPEKP